MTITKRLQGLMHATETALSQTPESGSAVRFAFQMLHFPVTDVISEFDSSLLFSLALVANILEAHGRSLFF
jgi:hypothetical protein